MSDEQARGKTAKFIQSAAVADTEECIVWPYSTTSDGYGQGTIDGQRVIAHRAVLQIVTQQHGHDLDAAHGPCHNRLCINPRHLSWKTRAENQADKARDGTLAKGERSAVAKLTDDQVREIRQRTGATQRQLAKEFGVTHQNIGFILRRKTWTHLLDETAA